MTSWVYFLLFTLLCFPSSTFRAASRAALAILLLAGTTAANAQEMENRQVVVQAEAEELPSAYGAPPDLSHGRISTLTKSYVLSPFSFELEAGYEGAVFAQSVEVPVLLPEEKLEVGVEMQYRSGGETIGPERTIKGLAIGPTLAWRPTKTARLDLSPLIGATDSAPALQVFAAFSFSFGGPATGEAETPASARG